MRTNRRVRSATLVLILIPALALLVSNPVEAKKKPKPPPAPEWSWEVEIPGCSSYSLCAEEQSTYADTGAEDGVWADVTTEGAGGGTVSRFGFAVFRCFSGERCHPDSNDLEQPLPVRLQGIYLGDYGSRDDPGTPCVFPGSCGGGDPPGCMECFLNGLHPDDDYRYVSFEVTVPGDFEDIEPDTVVGTWGNLYIDLFNTGEILLPPGEGDHHNIDGRVELLTGDAISIERVGDNTWMVRVTVDTPMLFSEWYVGCAKPPNKNGKCPTEYKHPLDSCTSGSLVFEATWTRTTQ